MIPVAAGIHQNPGSLVERSDHNILKAIVIQIPERSPALVSQPQKGTPHLARYILERLSVHIAEHRIVLPRIGLDIVDIAIRGVQILPTVVIVIDKAGAPARKWRAELFHARLRRNVAKEVSPILEQ